MSIQKLLLVRMPFYSLFGAESKAGNIPLGLCYIANKVRDRVDVSILDFATISLDHESTEDPVTRGPVNLVHKVMSGYSTYESIMGHPGHPFWDTLYARIMDAKPDVVAFTAMTTDFTGVCFLSRRIKSEHSIPVILGGPHPSALPAQSLHESNADIVVIGEGEETFTEVVEAIQSDRHYSGIRGIAYLDGDTGDVVLTPSRELIADLDGACTPARDLLSPEDYQQAAFGYVLTSRGCPYRCNFCASNLLWGRRVRYFSASRVADEIAGIYSEYGSVLIRFSDDLFSINLKRLEAIHATLEQLGVRITYRCSVRVDLVNERLVNLLARSGCEQVSMGIESGSQRVLNLVDKQIRLEQIEPAIQLLRDAGIKVIAYFMLGHPTETCEELEETRALIYKIRPDRVGIGLVVPFPGTPIHRDYVADESRPTDWWKYYSMGRVVHNISGVRTDYLEDFYHRLVDETKQLTIP